MPKHLLMDLWYVPNVGLTEEENTGSWDIGDSEQSAGNIQKMLAVAL